MTVICWDGTTLASDSRLSSDNAITTDNIKKLHKLKNVKYYDDTLIYGGFAGVYSDLKKILQYFNDGYDSTKGIDHRISGIIVGIKYVYELESHRSYLIQYPRTEKITAGSGGDFGRSAMKLGLSAKEAVKHTIELDLYCGGKIQSVNLGDKR